MSDRIKALTVILDRDYLDEDVKMLVDAIGIFRGVSEVTPVVTEGSDYIDRIRIRNELREQMRDVLYPKM